MILWVGDTVTLSATFTVDGVATTPTSTELKVKDPSGNTDTYNNASLSTPATGTKSKAITLDEAGTWYIRWVGTGAAEGVEETSLRVRASRVV